MTFMNPWLLLGALGIGLPILAHLLNRYQVKRTDWAAMRFLNRTVRVRSRQIRLRDILLLLLRCLAVLLLAFAISKPVMKKAEGFASRVGERRAGVIIALDVSCSMQHSDGSATRFERAIGKVETIAESIHPGDPVCLVMTLETDTEKNDRVWSRVAPLDRIPPLLAPRPGATVLVGLSDSQARADRYPLVAWQRYGTGKCMMMGTDRLWLLRFKTGDKYHWRVWSQCIQFLTLSRLMGEHKRIRLETDRTTYPLGGQALLYAHVLDDSFEPVTQSGFDVTVTATDGSGGKPQRVTLRPDVENPGLYEGYFSPPSPGRYRMEANSADRSLSNTTEFQVAAIKPEMANTDMQIEGLRRISDLSGGQCLSISRIGELSSLLNRKPHTTTVREELPLWDNALVAFLLVSLVGFEWIVRRRYDLP